MKSSEIIRAAKQYLWNGRTVNSRSSYGYYKYQHVCYAICALENNCRLNGISSKIKAIRKEIQTQLEGFVSLDVWLEYKAGIKKDLTARNIQRHRKQWMELLAQQYEAKGD